MVSGWDWVATAPRLVRVRGRLAPVVDLSSMKPESRTEEALIAPQAHYVQERAGYLGREIMMCRGYDFALGVHLRL